jgi:hypothetical protein
VGEAFSLTVTFLPSRPLSYLFLPPLYLSPVLVYTRFFSFLPFLFNSFARPLARRYPVVMNNWPLPPPGGGKASSD